jgi:hypothetical protein
MAEVIIAHFIELTTANGTVHYFQNFFYTGGSSVGIPGGGGGSYEFAPFRAEGSLASLNGENAPLRLLFPHSAFTIALVENGEGNRLSRLTMKTVWLANAGNIANYEDYSVVAAYDEYYLGVGATFDDTTVELRFRSSMDSVGAAFPRRTFNSTNVGILPINAEISLR